MLEFHINCILTLICFFSTQFTIISSPTQLFFLSPNLHSIFSIDENYTSFQQTIEITACLLPSLMSRHIKVMTTFFSGRQRAALKIILNWNNSFTRERERHANDSGNEFKPIFSPFSLHSLASECYTWKQIGTVKKPNGGTFMSHLIVPWAGKISSVWRPELLLLFAYMSHCPPLFSLVLSCSHTHCVCFFDVSCHLVGVKLKLN